MTTAQKRQTFTNRLGRLFRGGQTIQRSTPNHGPEFSDAQRSYLVDCGAPHDASDEDLARFANSLNDFERAELEQAGHAAPTSGTPATSGQSATPPAAPPIQRSGDADPDDDLPPLRRSAELTDPALDPSDVDGRINRALAQRDEADRQRAEIVRELAGEDIPSELVTRALTERWPESRIAREFLAVARNRPAPVGRAPAGHVHGSDQRNTLQALQGAMLLREGIALDDPILRTRQAEATLSRQGTNARWLYSLNNGATNDQMERARDTAHQFAGMALVDVCRMALQVENRRVPFGQEEIIRAALSTATLSAVFSTSINMQVLQAYMGYPDTTEGWTFETDVDGFRTQERGRLEKGTGVKKLSRGGTPEDITFSDATETYKISRYAGRFVTDEQDIADNHMGGMTEHTVREIGEMLREIKINLVYALLLSNPTMRDGVALFHADHGNTGTGLAWGSAAYTSVRASMAKQTENGRHISNRLGHIIAPEDLDFPVNQLLGSSELRTAASADGMVGTSNPHRGTATPHFDARLSVGVTSPDDGVTYSGSVTTWYGATDRGRHGIEVGFRRGTGRAPRVESAVLPVSEGYGIVHRGCIDVAVKAIDWRGLFRAQA